MQEHGVTSKTYQDKPFIGDHPPVILAGTLVSGQNLVHGTIVGKITASKKYTQLAPASGDGSQVAAAVLVGDLDASGGDESGVFLEHGVAVDLYLTWPDGITALQKATAIDQLQSAGIYVK